MFTIYIAQISMCIWSNALYNIDNLCYYISTNKSTFTLNLRLQFFIIIIFPNYLS